MKKFIFKICCWVALSGHIFTTNLSAQPMSYNPNEDEVILLLANRCNRSILYMDEIVSTAKALKKKYRIPVQVTIGIMLIESNGTQSELANKAGNLFGLTCSFDWDGPKFEMPHDQYNADGKLVTVWTCFRSYTGGPSNSVEDFGKFISNEKRWWFNRAKTCPSFDAECWIDGLSEKYATDPEWGNNIRNAISNYHLKVLDK